MDDHATRGRRRVLTGWGLTAPTGADVVAPIGADEVTTLTGDPGDRGVIARGLGRSYGDAAQNAGGRVLDMTGLTGIEAFNPTTGVVTADAGLSLDELMRLVVPAGWFPPVSPGTRLVTLGGALAADVHGKNHHVDGSFADAVEAFELVTPDGQVREITPDVDPDVFWATAGGMGLTGVVRQVTLRLRRIRTSRMRVDTERTADLDDLLARMAARDDDYRYSVAWIDLVSRRHRGRSVLTRGDHAEPDELTPLARRDAFAYDPAPLASVPPVVPTGMLNIATVAAFNEAWYRRHPVHRTGEVQSIPAFFHPLDGVHHWNRIYGRRGFLQYQLVVPFGAEETLRRIVHDIADARMPSFLAVLKRFGAGNSGHLSFPMPGWTLALDIPAGQRDLEPLLRGFDERVAAEGGRVYFAKDSRLDADMVPRMYPRLDEWRAVRDHLDPHGALTSDLDRRLNLTGHRR